MIFANCRVIIWWLTPSGHSSLLLFEDKIVENTWLRTLFELCFASARCWAKSRVSSDQWPILPAARTKSSARPIVTEHCVNSFVDCGTVHIDAPSLGPAATVQLGHQHAVDSQFFSLAERDKPSGRLGHEGVRVSSPAATRWWKLLASWRTRGLKFPTTMN